MFCGKTRKWKKRTKKIKQKEKRNPKAKKRRNPKVRKKLRRKKKLKRNQKSNLKNPKLTGFVVLKVFEMSFIIQLNLIEFGEI